MAGLQWNQQLDKELEDTSFGIIVVTPWNQHSQWLNFESGALSKRVGGSESRVAPLLIDFPNVAKLTGPLSGYQVVLPDKAGIHSLVVSLNQALGDESRTVEALGRAFEVCWPSLESKIRTINADLPSEQDPSAAPTPQPTAADDTDMLSEILTAVRGLARSDARLTHELRRSSERSSGQGSLRKAQDPDGGLQRRIINELFLLGVPVASVKRDADGHVTVRLPRPLTDEQEHDVVRGLDWGRFHISSLEFIVDSEALDGMD